MLMLPIPRFDLNVKKRHFMIDEQYKFKALMTKHVFRQRRAAEFKSHELEKV
jgi:hypothetical protein